MRPTALRPSAVCIMAAVTWRGEELTESGDEERALLEEGRSMSVNCGESCPGLPDEARLPDGVVRGDDQPEVFADVILILYKPEMEKQKNVKFNNYIVFVSI